MSQISPRLGLPFMQPAQAQKHVTHNEALQRLDAATQLAVESLASTVPPAVPETGEMHGIGAGASGAWSGRDGELAIWEGTAWLFLQPAEGWRAWDQAEGALRLRVDNAWQALTVESAAKLGINATADTVNRLAIAAESSLFSHDGAGHRLKLNKAAPGETATLLFQSDWSGRAEMGLAGSDEWSLKVSPDGSAWTTALQVNAATGQASGAAVQQSPTDVTAGRLMRADYGYGPGNVLGPIGQSGGIPTGAVIERGSNANGEYVRFADGTQMCMRSVTTSASAPVIASFAAAFSTTPLITTGVIAGSPRFCFTATPTTTGVSVSTYNSAPVRSADTVNLIAAGRWF